jgi:putative DNA primase/helicase
MGHWPISPELREVLLTYPFNDHGNALRIRAIAGENLLYSYAERCWFVWDERRWAKDTNGGAMRIAKQALLTFLGAAIKVANKEAENFAKRSLDHHKLTNALASLQCELPIDVNELDQQKFFLNFQNGTVDLRTGAIRRHDKRDRITRLVHHDYSPEANCPVFLRFMERVMGGSPDASDDQVHRAEQLVE